MAATAVYIGRFQPPHHAHLATMQGALEHFGQLVILPGSANMARSIRNPWSASERAGLIRAALRETGLPVHRVSFSPLPDEFDAARWAARVRAAVPGGPVALVGFEKDASSAYLRWFPEWTVHPAPVWPGLNATDLRAAYFQGGRVEDVPRGVAGFLEAFRRTPAYVRLQAEWRAVQDARAALPAAPLHEERWVQVEGSHVWLSTRHGPIGQGLWELPGRVLPPGQEPMPGGELFAHPSRALVAPTTAHVWRGAAPDGVARPVPLATALQRPRRFHEDHHVILRRLLGPDLPPGASDPNGAGLHRTP
ncbi:adenylyltransferase/cytidyltransferase family protein [Deinococcus hohokamensis]|uniref:Adenylyltransferase/cytidyltransferase family protein n=1 Tax=Deinococcus hohokamensis TaxID=309883 RepID=A0ABV9IBS7_9DEIO